MYSQMSYLAMGAGADLHVFEEEGPRATSNAMPRHGGRALSDDGHLAFQGQQRNPVD